MRLMEGVRHVSNTIAHNIRTPLSRTLARLCTAQASTDPSSELPAAVDFAIAEIQDLNVVFDKLLQIAEVESGTRRQTFGAVSLNAVAVDTLELYDALAETKGLVLTRSLDADPTTAGDGDLLANAVANLLDNAIKYTPSGGNVHVATRREGGWYRSRCATAAAAFPSRNAHASGRASTVSTAVSRAGDWGWPA